MTSSRRVLAVGLAHGAPRQSAQKRQRQIGDSKPPRGLNAKIRAQVTDAKSAGYDLEIISVKPTEFRTKLVMIQQKLSQDKPHLFIIGNGIRGNAEYTKFFEDLISVCGKASPGTKLGFNTRLDDTIEVCKRHFQTPSEADNEGNP